MNNDEPHINDTDRGTGEPPRDDLDALLRTWHQMNAERAEAARDRIVEAMRVAEKACSAGPQWPANTDETPVPQVTGETPVPEALHIDAIQMIHGQDARATSRRSLLRRLVMNRYSPIAAVLVLAAILIPTLQTTSNKPAYGQDTIMVPDGGRLDALDSQGRVRGPCPLKHTDVNVAVTGHFTRVTLTQKFQNPYSDKIEAVYTFPLCDRSAVDRMTMTIGDRVIVGEVHERAQARAMYEAARASGHIASLLEQERPNIFTQSVANIEPGAQIDITISYVELLDSKDGTYSFMFPMVVGPRYIPGVPRTGSGDLPAGLQRRNGVELLGPATFTLGQQGDVSQLGTLQTGKLATLLHDAVAIERPSKEMWESRSHATQAPVTHPAVALWYRFEAAYCDGSKDVGELFTNNTGHINGRWFYLDREEIKKMGTGFSQNTTQVPDASRITPEPVKPGTRAGHDISLTVTIDTGGPAIRELKSALHEMVEDHPSPSQARLRMKSEAEIPNRDFVLTWKHASDKIEEATFTHTDPHGNFFTLILQPPERVTDVQAVPRELVFVLDTSGSMSGFPIEKAKVVMSKAMAVLRPQDTFNLITFSGDEHILWEKPKPGTPDNIAAAQQFLISRQGSGGTEMMKAINAALVQTAVDGRPQAITPDDLANLPADGRRVVVRFDSASIVSQAEGGASPGIRLSDGGVIDVRGIPSVSDARGRSTITAQGSWDTSDRRRVFNATSLTWEDDATVRPLRVVCFMTDGFVGNDMQIIDAIKQNAGTTRVFSFGIGNSVNRYLLDNMARAGRGDVEYVLLESDADAAVKRFTQRIQTPVLTDIELQFSDNLKVVDLVPDRIPDLFDVQPLVLHGRYTTTGSGTLTIRGHSGSGRYERILKLDLPARQPEHDTIATLWARGKVEDLMNRNLAAAQQGTYPPDLREQVVNLGEQFQIMTQFTSFVAIEKASVTIAGAPRLVAVPIEMPQGVSYEGVFGSDAIPEDSPQAFWDFGDRSAHFFSDIDGDGADDFVTINNVGELGDKQSTVTNSTARGVITWDAKVSASESHSGRVTGMGAGYSVWSEGSDARKSSSVDRIVSGFDVHEGEKPSYRDKLPSNDLSNKVYAYPGQVQQTAIAPRPAAAQPPKPQILVRNGFSDVPDSGSGPSAGGGFGGGGGGGSIQSTFGLNAERSKTADLPADQESIKTIVIPGQGVVEGPELKRLLSQMVQQNRAQSGKPAEAHGLSDVESLGLQGAATQQSESTSGSPGTARDERMATKVPLVRFTPILGLAFRNNKPADVSNGRAIPFLYERIALGIAKLVKDGKLDEARKLAEELAKGAPEFKIGVQMRDVLADAKLAPAERDKRIAALADEARKPIDAVVREIELRRRLDGRLYRLTRTPATQPAPSDLTLSDNAVRVTVLLADVKADTLAALRQAGLKQEALAASSMLVVGQAPRNKLADIAMVAAVRRMDPTVMAQ